MYLSFIYCFVSCILLSVFFVICPVSFILLCVLCILCHVLFVICPVFFLPVSIIFCPIFCAIDFVSCVICFVLSFLCLVVCVFCPVSYFFLSSVLCPLSSVLYTVYFAFSKCLDSLDLSNVSLSCFVCHLSSFHTPLFSLLYHLSSFHCLAIFCHHSYITLPMTLLCNIYITFYPQTLPSFSKYIFPGSNTIKQKFTALSELSLECHKFRHRTRLQNWSQLTIVIITEESEKNLFIRHGRYRLLSLRESINAKLDQLTHFPWPWKPWWRCVIICVTSRDLLGCSASHETRSAVLRSRIPWHGAINYRLRYTSVWQCLAGIKTLPRSTKWRINDRYANLSIITYY